MLLINNQTVEQILDMKGCMEALETGYRDLIHAAIEGVTVPFTRGDAVESQWQVVEPVLGNATPLFPYEPGSWGPAEAARLTEAHGGWINPGGRGVESRDILGPIVGHAARG